MYERLIYIVLFILVLGLCEVQALGQEWDLAAYWDERYPSSVGWSGEAVRDALETEGYTILDADELKTWMDGHIADKELSVVVFCQDVVPDTVAETMTSDCTIRRYLDAGGKVVWYSGQPFYYQGTADGNRIMWGSSGTTKVLGLNASSGTNFTYEEVTITNSGAKWGLTETWESCWPTSPTISENMTTLATISTGSAAAWVKHYLPSDTYRGFVRTFDCYGTPSTIDDLIRLAEYIATNSAHPEPADGRFHANTWANISWDPGAFAFSHDVYFSDNFDDVQVGAESTFLDNLTDTYFLVGFPGFPFADGLIPGTTYYWRVDDVEADNVTKYEGDVWSFNIAPKTAYIPDPTDGAESVYLNVELSWTPGFGAKLHTVYFGNNFEDVYNAADGPNQGTITYNPGTLKMAKTYYWRVDEFDGVETHKGEVWSFFSQGAVGSPKPSSNGALDVKHTPILTWIPGIYADSYQVYFGTDKEAVINADTDSPEYKKEGNLGFERYIPGRLCMNTTYYWRINEFNKANRDSAWTGPVWSFSTGNFLVVDDFESYNDLDEGEPGSNRIYLTWVDGFDTPEINGSIVGYTVGWGTLEHRIVHGGLASMPYSYDNAVGISEATASMDNLKIDPDWTVEGVRVLSLWFRGTSANAPEPMYVALNGSAVAYYNNPEALLIEEWMEWTIDLQVFVDQSVNFSNVNSITLGFGNRTNPIAGGSGLVFFDDIRLYQPASEQVP